MEKTSSSFFSLFLCSEKEKEEKIRGGAKKEAHDARTNEFTCTRTRLINNSSKYTVVYVLSREKEILRSLALFRSLLRSLFPSLSSLSHASIPILLNKDRLSAAKSIGFMLIVSTLLRFSLLYSSTLLFNLNVKDLKFRHILMPKML